MIPMNLFTKQKTGHRLRKCTYGYQGGRMGERDKLGVWNLHEHTTILKIDNKKEKKTGEERNVELLRTPPHLSSSLLLSEIILLSSFEDFSE